MTHTDLVTMEDLLDDVGPERQPAWDRLALARAVANAPVAYRGQRHLSQRALAALLGTHSRGDTQSWEEWRLAGDDRQTYKTAAAAMELLVKLLEG